MRHRGERILVMVAGPILDFPILQRTPHEIVLIKPASVPTELTSDPKGVSLISQLRRACPPPLEPKLPHRLDRVTRGIILVALTPEAIAFHGEQIRNRKWEKFYLARVWQPLQQDIPTLLGQHKAYLKRVRHRAEIVRSGGKPSFLEILAIHAAPGRQGQAHALVKLLTGRFHQLRAMLAGLGVPLVGDAIYGRDEVRRRGINHRPRKGWQDFYLEHIVLKYVDYQHRTPCVAHLRDDPDREPVAPAMRAAIEALLG